MTLEPSHVFRALYEGNEQVLLQSTSFDWQTADNSWGTPLIALICGYRGYDGPERAALTLRVAKWCITQGANPQQHAACSCTWAIDVNDGCMEAEYAMDAHRTQWTRIGGQSALSIACAGGSENTQ